MMQLELTGFLGRNTGPFMEDLWKLLLSAQASPLGIPAEILEQKRAEIQKAQACHIYQKPRPLDNKIIPLLVVSIPIS